MENKIDHKPLIRSVKGYTPSIHSSVFLAETVQIIGDVHIDKDCSIWHGTVLRGDVSSIRIGERSNVQDNCVFHGTKTKGVVVGHDVTIGHAVILHGCRIGNQTLIGMGSCIMDEVHIPSRCLVGGGTLVTPRSQFEPESLILGRPGRMIRKLTDKEIQFLQDSANNYLDISSWYT